MMNYSKIQRLVLRNQFLILSKLDSERQDEYRRLAEIAANGFESHYESEHGHLLEGIDDPLSREDCDFVKDVVDMSWAVVESKLPHSVGHDFSLIGFDGNNEPVLKSYAEWFLKDSHARHRFVGIRAVNSHSRNRQSFERMVAAWKLSENPHSPTAEDLSRIISALYPNQQPRSE
jgi:uncharacterized protein